MPPGIAQPDFFYDCFGIFCLSSRCRSSCAFAVSSSASAPPCPRVIRALPEPPFPATVMCENSFSALKEEPLYDFPWNLGFDDPALRPMCCFCILAIGIESPKVANLTLTRTCQSSEPVPQNKPDNITSRAPERKGVVFAKSPPKNISPWPEVAKIVRGLGIPCQDDDFHCPMDCDTPENHIKNHSKKLKSDNSWPSEPTIIPRTKLLVKLLSTKAKLPTRGTKDAAGYDLYICEPTIIPPRTRKLVHTGISIAAPTTKGYARIALRSGLAIKGLDLGAGIVDSDYRGPIKVLLINNSDIPFQINTGDRMAQLILKRI